MQRKNIPNKSLLILSFPYIERVEKIKLFDVVWSDFSHFLYCYHQLPVQKICCLQLSDYVRNTETVVRRLKAKDLAKEALQIVVDTLVLSKISYALPVWGSFISANASSRVEKF